MSPPLRDTANVFRQRPILPLHQLSNTVNVFPVSSLTSASTRRGCLLRQPERRVPFTSSSGRLATLQHAVPCGCQRTARTPPSSAPDNIVRCASARSLETESSCRFGPAPTGNSSPSRVAVVSRCATPPRFMVPNKPSTTQIRRVFGLPLRLLKDLTIS